MYTPAIPISLKTVSMQLQRAVSQFTGVTKCNFETCLEPRSCFKQETLRIFKKSSSKHGWRGDYHSRVDAKINSSSVSGADYCSCWWDKFYSPTILLFFNVFFIDLIFLIIYSYWLYNKLNYYILFFLNFSLRYF